MNTSLLGRIWAWVKWPLLVLLVLFVGACIYFVNLGGQIVKTREAVAKIHATHLTREDVFGPVVAEPNREESNKTLVGVDANKNGIRDDVELDIYHAHQDSASTTAAMLQYALELQMEFTQVFNSETLVAVIQEQGRGSLCISDIKLKQEVRDLVFNTDLRKKKHEELFEKYMTSYSLSNNQACDLQL
jgi:hypothetical protein